MNLSDLMWLAGYLEGEGCFRIGGVGKIKRRPKSAGTPSVKIAATDFDVVERAALLMGVQARYSHRATVAGKPVYTAEASGERALRVMRLILPHMGKRRAAKINEVLAQATARLGRAARGVEQPRAKLTDDRVREVRHMASAGIRQVEIARRLGVSQALVSLVLTKQIWTHVGA